MTVSRVDFANTKDEFKLTHYLRQQGLTVAMIHGDIQPRERKRVMRDVQLKYQFVVATDLAPWVDIEGVSHVINDDIPNDLEFFIHRVGRTGRNGMAGTAITLYSRRRSQGQCSWSNGDQVQTEAIRDGELWIHMTVIVGLTGAKTGKTGPNLDWLRQKVQEKIKPGYKRRIRKDQR